MFDRTIINQGETRLVPYEKTVKIIEKKAPTDESIRLLNEMHQKAQDNILHKVIINDNIFSGAMIAFIDDIVQDSVRWVARFKLNNHEYKLEGSKTRSDFQHLTLQYQGWEFLVPDILDELSKQIAKALLLKHAASQKNTTNG